MIRFFSIFFILTILIIISIIVRVPFIEQSLWMDEGYTFLSSIYFLATGEKAMPAGQLYNVNAWFYVPLQAYSLTLFPSHFEWGLRFPSFIVGILMPIVFFIYSYYILHINRLYSIIGALIIAVSSWQIAWSTQGRWYMLLQFLYTALIIGTTIAIHQKNRRVVYLSWGIVALIFILLLGTNMFGYIAIPFLAIVAWIQTPIFKKYSVLIPSALLAISILSAIMLDTQSFSHHFWKYTGFLLAEHTGMTILFIASITRLLIVKDTSTPAFILSIACIFPFIALSFFIDPIAYRYLFPIHIIMIVYIFYAINTIQIQSMIRRYIVIILVTIGMFQEYNTSFAKKIYLESDRPNTINQNLIYTPQPDFKSAFLYVNVHKQEKEVLLTSYPELAYFYQSAPNTVLPFHWLQQTPIETLRFIKPEYTKLPHIYTFSELEKYMLIHSGYLVIDGYAFQKLDQKIQKIILNNSKKIFEKVENSYSVIYIYKF